MFGVPNDDLGEEVKAVVQLVDGSRADALSCADRLLPGAPAHFKCPRSVDFVDELPRLPTGKLYKGVLREQYWASALKTRIV